MKRPKAASPAPRGKADTEQFARFVELAEELGCEEGFERFEQALPRILKAPPAPAKPKAERRKKGGSAD
jgi:hypothetical protein